MKVDASMSMNEIILIRLQFKCTTTSYKRIQIPIGAVPSKIWGIGKVYVLFWGVFC